MNKSELIEAIGTSTGLDKRSVESAVDAFVKTVMSEVRTGSKVSLIGFGSFNPTSRKARTGRNPRTGDAVKIAASKGVRFAPGSAFKAELNSKGGAKKAAAKKAPAKTAPAKTAPAKTAPAKKAVVKKAPAKTAPAKKAPAKKR